MELKMLGNSQTVIFATFQKGKAGVINNIVKAINPTSFTLWKGEDGESLVFKNIVDLHEFLRKLGMRSLANTMLILDADIRQQSSSEEIAEIFLLYPELKIKTLIDSRLNRPVFNVPGNGLKRRDLEIDSPSGVIAAGCSVNDGNMLFDPAGIRNKMKMEMIDNIGFGENNYARKQKSREKKFALSLDHDPYHALFVGYALYNFGYSVLPVVSYKELKYLSSREVRTDLICRECDLQFFDMANDENKDLSSDEKKDLSSKIDLARGLVVIAQEEIDTGCMLRRVTRIVTELYEKLLDKTSGTTWFITQYESFADKKVGKKISQSKFKDINYKHKATHENPFYVIPASKPLEDKKPVSRQFGISIDKKAQAAFLRGQSKVIKGVYGLLQCPEVNRTYHSSLDNYEINRLRKKREYHAKTAVNLQLARKMLARARTLYLGYNYLEAAVLAIDALELSNGLSMILSLEILHLKIKAETRLELSIAGIGTISKDDIKEKIKELKINVLRICKDNDEAEKNALMQYFNGLRKIYHEFEQFEAAETLYAEVLKIETGIKRYKDLKLGKTIEKATKSKNTGNKDTTTLTQIEKLQVLWNTALSNFNFVLGFLLAVLMIMDSFMDNPLFPTAYFILFSGFCMAPKRAIYMIIGAGINFRRFIVSFLISQLVIALIYLFNYDYYQIPDKLKTIGKLEMIPLILRNTFLSSLMNQPSDTLSNLMEKQSELLHWLVNGHIAITIIFLGVFISGIYRWLTRR
ncbi:MAG: hypothetical protein JSV88_20460 [Candidatus Aminicenantes bacterium]|nr:MAG: hypothetical protein JSV88_20460 [Candidatus Aminicenantes bacterium]